MGRPNRNPSLDRTRLLVAQRIDYIEFEGDVKVTQQDRLATANKAIFYQKEQKIVLHGRPVVTKGQDRVEGNLITIYLKEGRSVVEGSGRERRCRPFCFRGKRNNRACATLKS